MRAFVLKFCAIPASISGLLGPLSNGWAFRSTASIGSTCWARPCSCNLAERRPCSPDCALPPPCGSSPRSASCSRWERRRIREISRPGEHSPHTENSPGQCNPGLSLFSCLGQQQASTLRDTPRYASRSPKPEGGGDASLRRPRLCSSAFLNNSGHHFPAFGVGPKESVGRRLIGWLRELPCGSLSRSG